MKLLLTKIKKNFAGVIHLLFWVTFLTAFGCDSPAKKAENKQPAFDLSFVDGSNGLPATEQWRQGLSFHDMNGDGNVDIVSTPPRDASAETKNLFIWHGNGKGEWSAFPLMNVPDSFVSNYGTVVASDFSGDGIPDIAAAMHGSGLRALKGAKNGKYLEFSKGMPSGTKFLARALVSADLNHDGVEDLAAVSEFSPKMGPSSYGGLLACFSRDGQWQCNPIGDPKETAGLVADVIVAGDVNADGNIDLGVSSRNSQRSLIVWLGDGKGNFKPFNKGLATGIHYGSVSFADVNNDGRDDLVASISGRGKDYKGLKVFLSTPEGFMDNSSEGLPSGEEWSYFASAGDLNGDGNVEIVAATKEGGLKIYEQRKGRWHELRVSGLPDKGLYRVYGLYCIDVNKDGRKDIAVIHSNAHEKTGGINVYLTEQ